MFGHLDAVGAIVNESYWNAVKVQDLGKPNVVAHAADAPVSYPFIWNAPQQDKVQWLGIAESGGAGDILSLVRNVGEVIGVFANVQIPDEVGILDRGYPSTIDRPGLQKLENLLKSLWSPIWPEADFGKIDRASAAKGLEDLQAAGVSIRCSTPVVLELPRRDQSRGQEPLVQDDSLPGGNGW